MCWRRGDKGLKEISQRREARRVREWRRQKVKKDKNRLRNGFGKRKKLRKDGKKVKGEKRGKEGRKEGERKKEKNLQILRGRDQKMIERR